MMNVKPNRLRISVQCGAALLVSWALATPVPAAQASSPAAKGRAPAQDEQRTVTRTVGSEAVTSAEALARDPRQHYGKIVMVLADVERVLGPRMFLLDEDAAFAGPDILVIVPSGTKDLTADTKVRVTGSVRPYEREDLEREFEWFASGSAPSIDLRGRPVIVAKSVKNAGGGELAGAMIQVPSSTATQPKPVRITAGELAEHSDQYLGKRVSVRAEVEEVHNRQLFTLDDDRLFVGPDVVVYARDGRTVVGDNQIVTVTGIVRKFIDTELFATATWFEPWFDDLDEAGRGLVRSRPLIVADSVIGDNGVQLFMRSQGQTAYAGAGSEASDRPARGTTRESNQQPTGGTDAARENGEDAAALAAGENVTLTGTVREMAADRAFWLAIDRRPEPIMVIVDAATMERAGAGWSFAANERVQVKGTVTEVPGRSDQVTVTDWGMPAEHAKRFSQQRTYIYADTVTRASQ